MIWLGAATGWTKRLDRQTPHTAIAICVICVNCVSMKVGYKERAHEPICFFQVEVRRVRYGVKS